MTSETQAEKDQAIDDINAIRSAIHNLLSIVWSSVTTEGSSLFRDLLPILRLSIADAAEFVQEHTGRAKESLRSIDKGVQQGQRDPLGHDKKCLEERRTPRSLGSMVWIPSRMPAPPSLVPVKKPWLLRKRKLARPRQDFKRHFTRLVTIIHQVSIINFIHQISNQAQSDSQYRQLLDTLFDIIQKRLNKTVDTASDPNITLSSFIADPTPEQHISKALALLFTLLERLTNTPLEPTLRNM